MCATIQTASSSSSATSVKTVAGKSRMLEGLKGFGSSSSSSSSSASSLSSTSKTYETYDDSSCFFDLEEPESSLRSILKNRSRSEPRFIHTDKRNWMCLPPPPAEPKELPAGSADSDTTDTPTTQKSVGFGSVLVRSYQQTMGDNPAVSYGPPISLDWDYLEHEDVCINVYESQRVFLRRNLRQLAMSCYRRTAFLRAYGFSEQELFQAQKEVHHHQWKRSVTFAMLPMMKVEDALESACRKAKRMIVRKHGKA